MGIVSRHTNAPFANGETLDGGELEQDFNNIVTEINGNLDNANIDANADIDGSKFADNTITNAKMLTNTLTTAKMAASAVTKGSIEVATANTAATGSTSFVDVPTVSSISLTPGSTSDLLVCFFTATMDMDGATGVPVWQFAFDFDGTPTDELALIGLETGAEERTTTMTWQQAAGTTSAVTIKPVYKYVSGLAGGTPRFRANMTNRIFHCYVLPIK